MILGVRWENGRPLVGNDELYKTLGILKINSLYKLGIYKFLRQLLDGHYPEFYDDLLRPYLSIHEYGTRRGMFRHPALVCEVERRFLPHQMILMYEELPRDLLNDNILPCLRTFKLQLLNEQ